MAYASDKEPTGLTAKTTPIDADVVIIGDSTDANEVAKKTTWANVKTTLKTYFDTLYAGVLGADDNYVTDAEKTKLSNLSGTNTGDQTTIVGITGTTAEFNTALSDGDFATIAGTETLTNKTLTSPKINENVAITATATELNYTDGVTSAIQTQLDGKLSLGGGTLTGNITLGENTSIALDPAGSADGKFSGITVTGTAGTALAFGDLVYLAAADSRWELADADSATTADRMLGMCVLAAGADGNATNILLQGIIRADAAFPALTIGSPVYVGETAGDVQTAIPTGADNVIRRVGFAMTADELYFNPSMDVQTTVA